MVCPPTLLAPPPPPPLPATRTHSHTYTLPRRAHTQYTHTLTRECTQSEQWADGVHARGVELVTALQELCESMSAAETALRPVSEPTPSTTMTTPSAKSGAASPGGGDGTRPLLPPPACVGHKTAAQTSGHESESERGPVPDNAVCALGAGMGKADAAEGSNTADSVAVMTADAAGMGPVAMATTSTPASPPVPGTEPSVLAPTLERSERESPSMEENDRWGFGSVGTTGTKATALAQQQQEVDELERESPVWEDRWGFNSPQSSAGAGSSGMSPDVSPGPRERKGSTEEPETALDADHLLHALRCVSVCVCVCVGQM